MDRSARVNGHGIGRQNQELNSTKDAEEKEDFFYFHEVKIGKMFSFEIVND